jgi:simple sugar transport system permease protein
MKSTLGTFFSNNRKFLPLSATILLFFVVYAIGANVYSGLRDPQIFLNLFISSPFLLISAVGMTLVVISGGIDLSVSGVVALTTVASAALLRAGWDPWLVILTMLLMGMIFGATMGSLITFMKVQPFIATLAGMWFARGMCFFISDDAIKITNRTFKIIGQTKILIPGLSDITTRTGNYITPLVVLMMLVFVIAIFVTQYTRFGRTLYAIGGNNGANENSARLMGLPVDRTKVLVYTINGLCSALAGIALSIYVGSGHGLYAPGFEMTVIAAVVIGGTMLTGGEGYVFGTLFGVLITGLIQTLIQFNGRLSSWWTNIVVGLLTLVFIGAQSLLFARKKRQIASQKQLSQAKHISSGASRAVFYKQRSFWLGVGGLAILAILAVVVNNNLQRTSGKVAAGNSTPSQSACQLQAYRRELAESFIQQGAILAYERNGGDKCIDEVYAIFPDGRIAGDNGSEQIEKQVSTADVEKLLEAITTRGWFTNEMYDTWHTPCGQCFGYYLTVQYEGQTKTIKAVDGGTDAPSNYWQVVALLNGITPKFNSVP